MIEFGEGEFHHIALPEGELAVNLAYKQLFISALWNFPLLSKYVPRRDQRLRETHGTMDPIFQLQFLKRAQLLGFRSEKIIEGLKDAPALAMPTGLKPCLALDVNGESLEWRWG